MQLSLEIKNFCDESLNELFSEDYFQKKHKHKLSKDISDPLFSEIDARLAFIIHSVTIRSGIILEKIYQEQIKKNCPNLEVWNEKKFKISKHAMQLASDQDNKDVIKTDLPYGEAAKIGKTNKNKTIQIDFLTFDKQTKTLNSYEIKRGGGHHDSEKQEKIIENLIAVRMLLKSYGEEEKNLEIKKKKSYIISHMNQELFSPNYRYLQINGNEIDEHFKAKIKEKIDYGYNYFASNFKKKFQELKSKSTIS